MLPSPALSISSGDNLRVILVRQYGPVFLNLPQSYINDLFIYLIETKYLHIHILIFDFHIPSLVFVIKVYK